MKNADKHILSADKFFINKRGQYNFDPTKLPEAHQFTQRQFTQLACQGVSPLIVDNTNMCYWEMYYYLQVAVQYKYHVEIMEPATPWKTTPALLKQKNIHSVPEATIINMRSKYEAGGTIADLLRTLSLDPVTVPGMRLVPPIAKEAPIRSVNLIDFGDEAEAGKSVPLPTEWNLQVKGGRKYSPEADSTVKKNEDYFHWNANTPSQIFEEAWQASKADKKAIKEKEVEQVKKPEPEPQPQRKQRKNKQSTSPKNLKPHRKNCPNENPDFTNIRDFYPGVKDSCLWDLFERCKGDAQWCVNLLCDENLADQMEGGSDLTCSCSGADASKDVVTQAKADEIVKPKPKSPVSKSKKTKEAVKQINLDEWLVTKESIEKGITFGTEHYPEHVNTVKSWKKGSAIQPLVAAEAEEPEVSSTNRDSPDSTEELHALPISNDLILELDEEYGGGLLSHLMEDKTFPPKIFIKRSTAHLFYLDIMEAYYSQCEEEKLMTLKKDEELAKQLSKEDEVVAKPAKVASKGSKKASVNISDLLGGAAIVENNWKNDDSSDDIALKMSKEKLIQLFPSIDKETLLSIFAGNEHNFDDTVATVEDSLFLTPKERAHVAAAKKKVFNTPWQNTDEKCSEAYEVEEFPDDKDGYTPEHLKTVEILRQEIKDHMEEQKVCINKAQDAIQKKNYEIASYLSTIAAFHKQMADEGKHAVANLVATIHANTQPSKTTLDLHFLNQIEATVMLDTFLDRCINRLRAMTKPYEDVFIITGRGKHSDNGKATIKNRTKSVLRQRNLK